MCSCYGGEGKTFPHCFETKFYKRILAKSTTARLCGMKGERGQFSIGREMEKQLNKNRYAGSTENYCAMNTGLKWLGTALAVSCR